ncbi:exocyst subunit [Coemansia sp. BCRC 34301]|nr:exocyst subunit [Coemansia sp. BCRC 34301]
MSRPRQRKHSNAAKNQEASNDDERKELALRQAEGTHSGKRYALWQLPRALDGIKRSDFNPVSLALQMMDSSSLGKSYEEFCYYYNQLNDSLDGIVNEYYGGFNNSILTFSGLHDKIQDASGSVNHVKRNLQKVRRMILEERGSLDQLYTKSNQLGAIVSILNRFEEVKRLPEELAGYAREKKFLTAASKLVQDMQFVFDPELNPIEALSGLRQQLEKEKSDLLRLIIDELHNHIYLKSPYCERKMGIEDEDDGIGSGPATGLGADESGGGGGGPGQKSLGRGADGPGRQRAKGARKAKRALDNSDQSNPEADSFSYVEMLIESLVALDNTTEAMQEVKSSINVELSRLIDGVINEVEERNRALIYKSKVADQQDDAIAQDTDREVLFDFTRILFARLETVVEYHDYVLDVVNSLDRRERYSLSPSANVTNDRARRTRPYTIGDVWSAIKAEILALLKDYLIPAETRAIDITHGVGGAAVTAGGVKPGTRDLFHIERIGEVADTVESLYLQIDNQFQDLTVSVAGKKRDTSVPAVIDEYADHQHSLRHKRLVESNIEHAPVMLNMALSFTKRVAPLLGSAAHSSPSALSPSVRRSMVGEMPIFNPMSPNQAMSPSEQDADEYLQAFFKKVFLPRTEAYAMQLFDAVTSASDAFDVDLNTYFNGRPIFRSAAAIVPLLHSFGHLLNDLHSFRGENWGILLQLSNKYYEKCWALFRDTIRSPDNQVYTSAKWSETPDMLQLFSRKLKQVGSRSRSDLGADMDKEICLEEALKTERSLHLTELIFDVKRLVCAAQLHQTLEWLLVQLNKVAADRAKVLSGFDSTTAAALLKRHEVDKVKVVSRYHTLSTQCLMTLRTEVRAHCTYYLDLATREGSYNLDSDALEPDQYIQALNADISAIEEKMENCLPADRLNLVFGGISVLMAHILIANTRYIRHFNDAGSRKMVRNILALQQNLTNIALPEESGLDKARRFYELYDLGTDGILKHIAEHGAAFSFDNYRRLIDFIYSGSNTGGLGAGRAANLTEAQRSEQYEKHIGQLRELLSQAQSAPGVVQTQQPASARATLLMA